MITIYVVFAQWDEAERIVQVLLEKRLIACANTFPVQSHYWWKGKIEASQEIGAYLKTLPAHWKAVRELIDEMHSYDLPCIEMWPADTAEAYKDYLTKET